VSIQCCTDRSIATLLAMLPSGRETRALPRAALVGVVKGEADQRWFVVVVTCPLSESPFPLSVAVWGAPVAWRRSRGGGEDVMACRPWYLPSHR
jgi:hypothetical protein